MKRYSLEELQKMAREYFDRFQVKKLFATTDGQFFLLQSRAELHARNNLKVYCVEEDEDEASAVNAQEVLSVKQLSEKLQSITDLKEVQGMLHAEAAGANRKTAIAAIEARCREIAESVDVRNK